MEFTEALRSLVDALPPIEREVINGLYYERAPIRVIGKRLGLTHPGSVTNIQARALTRLRYAIDQSDLEVVA